MSPRILAMGTLLALGCAEPTLGDRPVHLPPVLVETTAVIPLHAVMPSDALLRDDGSMLVLDGYGGQVLEIGAGSTTPTTFSQQPIGRASRLSAAFDGGIWVARPGEDETEGSLLHLDAMGEAGGVTLPRAAEDKALHPVDVLDTGDTLVVADRGGGIYWIGPVGIATRTLKVGAYGENLRRPVDLVGLTQGFEVVDLLAGRLIRFSTTGDAIEAFGHPGESVGTLSRPTAVASVPGGLLVADSELGAVQAFEADGTPIGALSDDKGPLALGHPVAVRSNPKVPGTVLVLEASPAQLRVLHLATLPAAGPPALLRTTLVAADDDPAGEHGDLCSHCHDGLVRDSREVWDPARGHHPVGIKPERPLPGFFPLDKEGRITCRTCHSPHGAVDKATADTTDLVRHQLPGSLFMRLDKQNDALCTACHIGEIHDREAAVGASLAGGGHLTGSALVKALEARKDGSADPTKARCLSCHATHGAVSDPILRAPDDAPTCLGCHEDKEPGATNHPLGRVPGKDLLKITARTHVRLADGGVGCLTCHDLGSKGFRLLRDGDAGQPVCLSCHTQRTDLAKGVHRTLGKNGAPPCVSCHNVHGAQRSEHFVRTEPKTAADPRGCLQCHGPGGQAAAHSQGASPSRLGHPVTGAVLEHPTPGSDHLDCLACHDPHLANQPTSEICLSCHAEQSAAKLAGGHGKAECLDCHEAHRANATFTGTANPASARCLACHARGEHGAPAVGDYQHPTPVFLPDGSRWTPLAGLTLYGADGKPAAPGANGDLTCQSCHVVHGPDGSADHLRRATGWQDACAACHGNDALVFYRNFHKPERRASLTGKQP